MNMKGLMPYLLIALIAFAVYARTLTFGFSGLDDTKLIIENFEIIKDAANLPRIFQQGPYLDRTPGAQYRPMHILSFMIEAHLGGKAPFVYHLSNILTHIIGAWLVFFLLVKLGYQRSLSFIFTALFTVHPALTQAVAWIPGRNDPQMAVFALLSFICFLYFLEKKQWRYFAGHLAFFILALLTKETAVVLAVICPLYVLLIRGGRDMKYALGVPAAALIFLAARQMIFAQAAGYTFPYFIGSILTNSPALLVYLGKVFFPIHLSALPILKDSSLIYGIITAALIMFFLLISKEKRWNYVLFGTCWFAFFILAVLVKLKTYPVLLLLENRAYLPMVGIIIVSLEIDFIKKAAVSSRIFLASAATVLIMFSAATISHSGVFSSPINLWENAAKTSSHFSNAHMVLGHSYYYFLRFADAERELEKCLNLDPMDAMAHHNLAAVYSAQKRYSEAVSEYEKELEIAPRPESRVKLASLYCITGKLDKAEKILLSCIRLKPVPPKAHYYLGGIYLTRKQYRKAEIEYLKELKVDPKDAETLNNLAAVYYREGRREKAAAVWKKAAKADPDRIEACEELARYYCRSKNFDEAASYLNEVRLRGGNVSKVLLRSLRL